MNNLSLAIYLFSVGDQLRGLLSGVVFFSIAGSVALSFVQMIFFFETEQYFTHYKHAMITMVSIAVVSGILSALIPSKQTAMLKARQQRQVGCDRV